MLSLSELFNFVSENSFFVTLIVVGVLYCTSRRTGFYLMKTKQMIWSYTHQDSDHCNDPNCVRCNKYHDTVLKALTKIASVHNRVISFKIQKGLDFIYRPIPDGFRQKPNVLYYDNLESRGIWNKRNKVRLTDCLVIENSVQTVRDEVKFLLENPDSGIWKRNRTPNGSWDVFHLINQGSAVEVNQSICPKTMDIINSMSSVMKENVFGNVMLSVLKPGTIITPHYGPTNIRLRCHLGLKVAPEYLLTVDEQTVTWENGKCLVFDDSFLHSVKHECLTNSTPQTNKNFADEEQEDRVVLIIDLWHPDLSGEEREAINLCFQP